MKLPLWLSLLSLWTAVSPAGSATQTDWSSGPGLSLWVTEWGSSFGPAYQVYWLDQGSLRLDMLETDLATDVDDFSKMTLVDLDGDGLQDVLASRVYGHVIWFRNTGPTLPWPWYVIFQGSCADKVLPVPADMDGDGDPDVVFADHEALVQWAENRWPDPHWPLHPIADSLAFLYAIDVADVDGDGDADVLGASGRYGEWVGWWEDADGTGTAWAEHFIDDDVLYPYGLEAEDVNLDGRPDLLLADADSDPDRARWYENPGPPWTAWPVHVLNDAIDKPRQITALEMNGQPGTELLMYSVNADEMCWFEQGPPDTWTRHVIESGEQGVWAAYPSDIDGDGDQDLGVYQQGMKISLYWNPGSEPWIPQRITLYGHPGGCVVLDYDLDGQNEILVSHVSWNGDIPYLGAFELDAYEVSGTADSKVLDTQESCDWGTISWDAVGPSGTGVAFQVASGPLYTLMGDWSDTLETPCDLDGILVDGDRFVQYRAILRTSDPLMTPELQEVTITWNPMGMEEPQVLEPLLEGPFPNPVTRFSTLRLTLDEAVFVSLHLFDVSGRLASVLSEGTLPVGTHELQLPHLPAGVYLLRAVLGGETSATRFVVID